MGMKTNSALENLQREFEKREAQIKEAALMWSKGIQEVEA